MKILDELNHSINEITKAATQTYRNNNSDQSEINAVIMYSVYGYLIIRVSAFYDELTNQLEKLEIKKTRELREAISHFKNLYRIYKVNRFRNYIAHNRKAGKVNRPKKNTKVYRYITDVDIAYISKLKSAGEFESFSVATNRILESLHKLKRRNERNRKSN